MRSILAIIFAAFALTARADDRITLTVTVTNTPAGHNELTVNGNTRQWTNSATASPQSLVTIGASIGASATNLFRQIATYPYAGPLDLGFSSSNVITLRGQAAQAMAASISGTWASLSYSTQTVATLYGVRVPFSAAPAFEQTNNPTQLATGMGTYSQSAFAAGTTLLNNIVQTTGTQTIAGDKTFSGSGEFTTVLTLSGSAVAINNSPYYELYEEDQVADSRRWKIYANGNNLKIGAMADDGTTTDSIIFSRDGSITTAGGDAVLALNTSTINDSSLSGTITHGGEQLYSRANHTALANGNNAAVALGETVYTKIKAGPTAAFAICGIAGGADGRMVVLQNATGQNMTISNDSGVDPTAANRIYTQTGSDIATTGNGTATLIYDSEDSRWILVSIQQ